MKISTRGLVAGALGLGLLAGGSTFALWSSTASVAGGTITAGNLAITAANDVQWRDVSPGVTPHEIDPATFLTVPGDHVTRTQSLNLTATGDNMSASLNVTSETLSVLGADPAITDGFTARYTVLDGSGAPLGAPKALGEALNIQVPKTTGTTPKTVTVVIDLELDESLPGQSYVNAQAALGKIDFTLAQNAR